MRIKPENVFFPAYAILCCFTIYYFNGTGDVGDSIAHYLFAKHAPAHPELYFDHWAKPVYVLLASPFAQFGFNGVKAFNALLAMFTIYITYKVALKMGMQNAWLVMLIMVMAPLNYILTYSALTEPLFSFFVVLGLWMCLTEKYHATSVLISFLPYVRSEGLIIMGVFGFYFLLKHQWKALPWLMSGSVVYGIAGYFVHNNLLWVFTKIPYATLGSVYGKGTLDHFIIQLTNAVGIPEYILLWLGTLYIGYFILRRRSNMEETVLIAGGFVAFFIAHTLFWYLGIFNSMGLLRVFIGVMPLMALIILKGFNGLTEDFVKTSNLKRVISSVLIIYIVVFPFTPNPSAIQWKKDMMLRQEQALAWQVGKFFKGKELPKPLLYHHHYLSEVLGVDHFSEKQKQAISWPHIAALPKGGIIIWDNLFSTRESAITKEDLDNDRRLTNEFSCYGTEYGKSYRFAVYVKE